MPQTRECDYCGADIEPGTGTMFVRKNGTTIHFCSSKCEKNADLGREARDLSWTEAGGATSTEAAEDEPSEEEPAEAEPAEEPTESESDGAQSDEESDVPEDEVEPDDEASTDTEDEGDDAEPEEVDA